MKVSIASQNCLIEVLTALFVILRIVYFNWVTLLRGIRACSETTSGSHERNHFRPWRKVLALSVISSSSRQPRFTPLLKITKAMPE